MPTKSKAYIEQREIFKRNYRTKSKAWLEFIREYVDVNVKQAWDRYNTNIAERDAIDLLIGGPPKRHKVR